MCGILFTLAPSGAPAPDVPPELTALISRRGPDSTRTHPSSFRGYSLSFTASVLSLRGTHVTPQPLVDAESGSVLCWNGEAWRIGDDALVPGVNDGEEVFKLLLRAGVGKGLKDALESIRGPFALVYFDAVAGRVWFGRDALGRRSLLWRQAGGGENPEGWGKGLVVASVGDGEAAAGWHEVGADGLRFLDLVTGHMGWVPFMWGEDAAAEGRGEEFMRMPFPKLNTTLTDPLGAPTPGSPEVTALHAALLDSITARVRDIPGRGEDVRLAIMFSGGLDCTMLARLVHECLPLGEGVDLLNVAFENRRVIEAAATKADKTKKPQTQHQRQHSRQPSLKAGSKKPPEKASSVPSSPRKTPSTPPPPETDTYELCPDRKTGRQSLAELRRVCPGRDWRFIAINIPYPELLEHRPTVINLIHPHNTEMDFSIAIAFYFASRGTGLLSSTLTPNDPPIPYTTPARILFSGLGADELMGGYARHSTIYRFKGVEGLLGELQLEVARLGKRNLGRDDRVLAHWGREARYPFLEEKVVGCCMKAGWEGKRDKGVLRCLGKKLGMVEVAGEAKRAVQFGSRSARMEGGEKGKVKGTKVLAERHVRF